MLGHIEEWLKTSNHNWFTSRLCFEPFHVLHEMTRPMEEKFHGASY